MLHFFKINIHQPHVTGMLTATLLLFGCFKGPGLFKQGGTNPESARQIVEIQTNNGVSSAAIMDNSITQLMSVADRNSEISGSSISFPPGALAIGTEITMQAAVGIATASTLADMGLESSVGIMSTSAAVQITNSQNVNAASPFTLAIGLPDAAALALSAADDANVVVIYKSIDPESGLYKMGMIPNSELSIADGKVVFQVVFFGAFQATRLSTPVLVAPKEVITSIPIMTRREEKALPPIVWSLKAPTASGRGAVFSFTIDGLSELKGCVAIADRDKQPPWDGSQEISDKRSFSYRPTLDTAHTVYVAFSCSDKAGRDSGTSEWSSYSIAEVIPDTPPNVPQEDSNPTVTLTSSTPVSTNSVTISATLTFSQAVSGLESSEISISGGTITALTGSGMVYDITITAAAAGAVSVSVPAGVAVNSTGQSNAASNTLSFSYDPTPPTATITTNAPDPTGSSPIAFTVAFSESVSGFSSSGDLVITNGALTGSITGSGSSYTFSVAPTANGNVSVKVSANAASDTAGNANLESSAFSIVFNATAPTVTISSSVSSPTNSVPILVAINFSEPVTGFTLSDLSVTNGSAASLSGSGASYSVQLTPSAQGTVTVDLAASSAFDADNIGNTISNTYSIVYDSTAPVFNSLTLQGSTADGVFGESEFSVDEVLATLSASDYSVVNYTDVLDDDPSVTCNSSKTYSRSQIPRTTDIPGSEGRYALCVRLTDNAGNSQYGKSGYFVRDAAPTVSDDTIAGVATGSTVSLDWDLASDSAASQVTYKVYKSSSSNIATVSQIAANGDLLMSATTGADSYVATGLSPLTSYYFNVLAEDIHGNKLAYDMVQVTTDAFDCNSGTKETVCVISSIKSIPNNVTVEIPGELTIQSGGKIESASTTSAFILDVAGDLIINGGGEISGNVEIIADDITINTGAVINANGRGESASVTANSSGNGSGGGLTTSNAGAGGSYGGTGGRSSGGPTNNSTYGSNGNPAELGSSGGTGVDGIGGAGGGALKITTTNTLTINGSITANGSAATGSSGGGSGGAIWIAANMIVGTGTIAATGGDGAMSGGCFGGGGGGGRIAFHGTANHLSGPILLFGGARTGGSSEPGNSGTYYQNASNICTSGALSGSSCTISTSTVVASDQEISGDQSLTITSSGSLRVVPHGGSFRISLPGGNLVVQGGIIGNLARATARNIDITASGIVTADYAGSFYLGSGKGTNGDASTPGMGGAHGGNGGGRNGSYSGVATSFGSADIPEFGGGAGGFTDTAKGGAGGGYIKLVAKNDLTIAGTVQASGEFGGHLAGLGAGGGAGGSIHLFAESIIGAGTLSVTGGNGGGSSATQGGGGSGGRIAKYCKTCNFTGTVAVAGGLGNPSAGNGYAGSDVTKSRGLHFNTILVTHNPFLTGAIANISGANDICSDIAVAESFVGTWVAVLSDGTFDASITLNDSDPTFNLFGDLVAPANTLFTATIVNPVKYDEMLEAQVGALVWTGMNGNASISSDHCSAWGSGSSGLQGAVSLSTATSSWLNNGAVHHCDQSARLYCLSQ